MQTQIFRGTARNIYRSPDSTDFWYHKTCIVQSKIDGAIRLHSGCWRTPTTKNAMNQASNQFNLGFCVYQRDFDWFVTWRGVELPFRDGMILE